MALVACHECKKEVSTEAKTCPACGAKVRKPPKQTSRQTWFVLGGFGLIVVFGVMGGKQRESERIAAEAAKSPEQKALEQKARNQDALATVGAASLKKAMKDPKSFTLTSALVMDDGTACYEYRAMNSFGASLPSRAVMLATGKMMTKDQDGGSFSKAWNGRCANKSGREIANIIEIAGALN